MSVLQLLFVLQYCTAFGTDDDTAILGATYDSFTRFACGDYHLSPYHMNIRHSQSHLNISRDEMSGAFQSDPHGVVSYHPGRSISFTVLGNPIPKKSSFKLQNGHVINPSMKDEKTFRNATLEVLGDRTTTVPLFKARDSLFIEIRFILTGGLRNTDIDNLIKLVFDAMKGVIYEDDRDIVRVTASKEVDMAHVDGKTLITVVKLDP
jgi:hypothetical protein